MSHSSRCVLLFRFHAPCFLRGKKRIDGGREEENSTVGFFLLQGKGLFGQAGKDKSMACRLQKPPYKHFNFNVYVRERE